VRAALVAMGGEWWHTLALGTPAGGRRPPGCAGRGAPSGSVAMGTPAGYAGGGATMVRADEEGGRGAGYWRDGWGGRSRGVGQAGS
jgi:hypothetical protein